MCPRFVAWLTEEVASLAHEISNAVNPRKTAFVPAPFVRGTCGTAGLSVCKALWDLDVLGLKGNLWDGVLLGHQWAAVSGASEVIIVGGIDDCTDDEQMGV